ncbi:putative uncharacterized protein DDB_G0286901 [Cotesia glomerata]|uniref:putative uncharacterized protein DDB_G0286901 n=1 Tax=Cotesia glomerata TaxID=32391 RepID=UPI001D024F7C|nr:putative uncharacterized protein DDB_G0286901 [Cotesia glomerata]
MNIEEKMNNIKTAFDKLLEEDQEYFEFVDNESLCTTCKLEIDDQNFNSVAVKQENSIHFDENIYSHSLNDIDSCQELQKATRSLSRISLDQNDFKLTDNDINNLEQTNHQVIINDIINNNNDAVIVENSLFNYSPSFVCTGVDKALTILEQNLEDSNVKKTRVVTSEKNDPAVNDKLFLSDKETQTDLANGSSQQDNLWVDNEFLSDKELEKIDLLVNEHANGDLNNNNNNKRKCDNVGSENSAKKIKLGAREWNKDDWDFILSDILKREKKCLDCSNDLFEYSEYLNETRKAFIRKTPSTNIKIPTPPVLVGYDNQFDFKNEKRYGQLPIQKIKIDGNNSGKLNGVNGIQNSVNTKSKIHPQKIVTPNQGTVPKSRVQLTKNNLYKINNQVNFTPRNTLRQSTIKEAFAINKENHNKGVNNVKTINNTKSLEKTLNGDAGKDNISDSSSMYNFNPFRRKINAQKK